MRGYVGNTDYDWYRFLLDRPGLQEVNFWQPSGRNRLRAEVGSPFFFRLKSPRERIAGMGFFSRHAIVPDWMAWETFGEANGAASYEEMRERIGRYRRNPVRAHETAWIGCVVVSEPVLFPQDGWVPDPAGWKPNIVQGRYEDLTRGEGKRILDACLARRASRDADRHGAPMLVRGRLGQRAFKLAVVDAYAGGCAVTGEHSLPALDAAHIRPYERGGEHRVDNGLLLRTDVHRLYDRGYLTVTADHRLRVSSALREEFHNGRSYYGLDGRRVALPERPEDRPDREALAWHADAVFLGT
jgi:putative restriction endonuclease